MRAASPNEGAFRMTGFCQRLCRRGRGEGGGGKESRQRAASCRSRGGGEARYLTSKCVCVGARKAAGLPGCPALRPRQVWPGTQDGAGTNRIGWRSRDPDWVPRRAVRWRTDVLIDLSSVAGVRAAAKACLRASREMGGVSKSRCHCQPGTDCQPWTPPRRTAQPASHAIGGGGSGSGWAESQDGANRKHGGRGSQWEKKGELEGSITRWSLL